MSTATAPARSQNKPQPGETWRHADGGLCTVRDVATPAGDFKALMGTTERIVSYTCPAAPGEVFTRTLHEWLGRFTLETPARPQLSVVPQSREGILRNLVESLDPSVVDVIRDMLAERIRQDEKHGRIAHTGRVWLHKLDEWKVKLSEALLLDDKALIRRRCVQVMAIGLAMLELGFEPIANEELPAPGVEFEEDETDDFGHDDVDFDGTLKCICLPAEEPDDACPVHGELGGES